MKTLRFFLAATIWLSCVRAEPHELGVSAPELVDLERAKADPEYRERVACHRAIKSYLSSPLKGKAELEDILIFLLKNGFSIRDLHNAYLALHFPPSSNPTKRPEFRQQMLEQGVGEDQVQALVAHYMAEEASRRRRMIQIQTGLWEDEKLLDEFMRLAPESPAPPGPSSTFMPVVEAEAGERLLTDTDWMSDAHRKAAAAYRGERRRMIPKPQPSSATEPYKMTPRLVPRALPKRGAPSTNILGKAVPGLSVKAAVAFLTEGKKRNEANA